MKKKKTIHVVPKNNGWAVRSSGSSRVSKTYRTKNEAYSAGRSTAIRRKTELVVHNKNGKIGIKNSYGKDKFPPKG